MFEIVVFDGDISMLKTMSLSVSISPRDLYSSLESFKKQWFAQTHMGGMANSADLIKSGSALSLHTLMP